MKESEGELDNPEPVEGEGSCSAANSEDEHIPWRGLRPFFVKTGVKGDNILAKCLFCKKIYSSSASSKANLEKHLKTHPSLIKLYEKEKESIAKRKISSLKNQQVSLPSVLQKGLPVSQATLDKAILQYIIMNCLPFNTVDSDEFRSLVLMGRSTTLRVMCRQTLTNRIAEMRDKMVKALPKRLENVEIKATTADGWSKFKRAFLGGTIHWIDPIILERKNAALGVWRLIGNRNYKLLATKIDELHKQYEVHNKVCITSTDNASNFVKAFNTYNQSESATSGSAAEGAVDEEDESPISVADILVQVPSPNEDTDDTDIVLPPHQRCCAHSLNLIASKDSLKPLIQDAHFVQYRSIHCSCFSKIMKLWRKQNKSSLTADAIHEKLGKYLPTPNELRWNAEFDCAEEVEKLAKSKPDTLNAVFDAAGLTRLSSSEIEFLSEYCLLMGSVAKELDILQGEKKMYYGYLLPTIKKLKANIQGALTKGLKHSKPLADALLRDIEKRFSAILEEENTILAACVHPKFKFDWVENQEERERAEKIVKNALIAEAKRQLQEVPLPAESADAPDPDATGREESMSDDDDEFFGLSSKRPRRSPLTAEEAATAEFHKFLVTAPDVSAITQGFPLIKAVFIRTNTPLPSSAPVERLFSLAGIILSCRRAGLSDEHMETLVLLKANASIVDI